MVIVDTSVWIDFLNRRMTQQTSWLLDGHAGEALALTTLVLTEALQGIRGDSEFRKAEHYFRSMPVFEVASIRLAVASAQNFRTLRSLGITIRSTIDCLQATFCIDRGYRLLHSDRDFDAFEQHLSLQVVHP